MSENNLKTPDELKEEKNEKIRKNLRLIAIFVALWYFISAGWGRYEEIQKEEAQQEVAAVLQSENTLYSALKQNLDIIPPFDANSVLAVSDSITLEPTRNEDKINGIIINLHDKSTVDDKTYDTIFFLITTLECGEQKSDPKEIMDLLGLKKSEQIDLIKDSAVQSPILSYDLKKNASTSLSLSITLR